MTIEPGTTLDVVFFVRPDLYTWPGGDTTQIALTEAALRGAGHTVTVTSDPQCRLPSVDMVHLWHLERVHGTYIYFRRAVNEGWPTVLSTIYWPYGTRERAFREPTWLRRVAAWREDVKILVRYLIARDPNEREGLSRVVRRGWLRCRQELLQDVDMLFPNSRAEADVLAKEGRARHGIQVVPNVVDEAGLAEVAQMPWARREGVVCVGHFCPRKNQMLLIQALRDTDISVTFVGGPRRMHKGYYARCVRRGAGKHRFVGAQSQWETWQRLAGARLNVCPSWAETPGLVNLEAGLLNCRHVLPDSPPVRECFGDNALYFRPGDEASVREAVLRGLGQAGPPPDGHRQHIEARYSRNALLRPLLLGYAKAMAKKHGGVPLPSFEPQS